MPDLIKQIFIDPKLFNYLAMTIYLLSMIRWGIEGSWQNVWYWASALSITACVTFGYKH